MGFKLVPNRAMEFCKGILRIKKDETDRLSELPDCLIHCIMNFLPIGDAVRTNILSKRFRTCWKGIQVVKFDKDFGENFPKGEGNHFFVDVVESVIKQLNGPLLEIEYYIPQSGEKVSGIEKKEPRLVLPYRINKGLKPYLTKLSFANCLLCLPSSGSGFDNLVSLTLCSVGMDEKLLETFTSKYPKLESLVLIGVYTNGNNPVVVDAPKLRTLEYRSSHYSLRLSYLPCLTSCTIDSKVECAAGESVGSYFQQFFSLMPKLKELNLGYRAIKSLVDIEVPENTQKVPFESVASLIMIFHAMRLIRTSLNLKTIKFALEDGSIATADIEVLLRIKESELLDEIEASYSRCSNAGEFNEMLQFIRQLTKTAIMIREKRNDTHPDKFSSMHTETIDFFLKQ